MINQQLLVVPIIQPKVYGLIFKRVKLKELKVEELRRLKLVDGVRMIEICQVLF